jgi:tetratricopeptide (TPR) repeat protein
MTSRSLAASSLLLALAGAGCMQTTIKPERRILTQDEAARANAAERDKKKGVGEPVPPPPEELSPAAEIEELRRKAEKEPLKPEWHFKLGMLYERQTKYELAELRYREGGRLIREKDHGQENYTGPHFFLGRVLAKQGKWEPALAELKAAVAVKPPTVMGDRPEVERVEGYYLNPDYRESYYLIGAIQYRLGALTDSEKAFKLFLKYGGEKNRVVDYFPEMIAD